ncbi:MAG: LPXTG cell wall anchor domain-containing protein [Dermatophilaceae bacterium]
MDITAPATGSNSATTPDDPTFDAGIVSFNLTLVKKLTTTGAIHPGSTVTFTLTPHNDGPVAALAGWKVTEVLPAGLTLTGMTGTGYTCAGDTCTAADMLNPGTDGPVITVTATVDAGFTGTVRNIAYVSPSDKDVPETNPLGPVPTRDTDTKTTPTDNDSEAPVTITPVPLPKTGSDTTTTMMWLALLLIITGTSARIIATTRRNANGRASR